MGKKKYKPNNSLCLVSYSVLGSKYGKRLMDEYEFISSHNGQSFTASRFKSLYTAALNLKDGKPIKQILVDGKIEVTRNGYPKNPVYRDLLTRFKQTNNPSKLKALLGVLRGYTTFHEGKTTQKQQTKLIHDITDPNISLFESPVLVIHSDILSKSTSGLREIVESAGCDKLIDNDIKEFFRGDVDLRNLSSSSSYYIHSTETITDVSQGDSKLTYRVTDKPYQTKLLNKKDPFDRAIRSILNSPIPFKRYVFPHKHMGDYVISEGITLNKGFNLRVEKENHIVGKISVIQEAGCKARVVATPSAYVQASLFPIATALKRIEKLLPFSVVYNQNDGPKVITDFWLRNFDKPIVSVDMSAATDRLPLDFSIRVINRIHRGLGDVVSEYYTRISRDSNWEYTTIKGNKILLSWACGQPMGLFGSFQLLNITNYVLGNMATQQLIAEIGNVDYTSNVPKFELYKNGKIYKSPYAVLGDDIVFSDMRIADKYKHILDTLGVKISTPKCYTNQVTEFAGFIGIRPNRPNTNPVVFRPFKWSCEDNRVTNLLGFLDAFSGNIHRKWQKEQLRIYNLTRDYRNFELSPIFHDSEATIGISNTLTEQLLYTASKYGVTVRDNGLKNSFTKFVIPDKVKWEDRAKKHEGHVVNTYDTDPLISSIIAEEARDKKLHQTSTPVYIREFCKSVNILIKLEELSSSELQCDQEIPGLLQRYIDAGIEYPQDKEVIKITYLPDFWKFDRYEVFDFISHKIPDINNLGTKIDIDRLSEISKHITKCVEKIRDKLVGYKSDASYPREWCFEKHTKHYGSQLYQLSLNALKQKEFVDAKHYSVIMSRMQLPELYMVKHRKNENTLALNKTKSHSKTYQP